MSVDPLAGKYPGWSPYNYVANNPLILTDPDGRKIDYSKVPGRKAVENAYSTFRGAVANVVSSLKESDNVAVNFVGDLIDQLIPQTVDEAAIQTTVAGLGTAAGLSASTVKTTPVNVSKTETVQRFMSKNEVEATKETGLVRGGRAGTHHVTDAGNSSAKRARQRLSLQETPEAKVTMEVPAGSFSKPSRVARANNMPGGGMERTATGNIPAVIKKIEEFKY
jgi:hypothetical protein